MPVKTRTAALLVLFFAAVSLVLGFLVWRQSRALAALQHNDSDRFAAERSALMKKLADAEHRAHSLENELASLKAQGAPDGPPEGAPGEQPGTAPQRGRWRGNPEAFAAFMNDPKMVKLMNSREKLLLDSRYAALFKALSQNTNFTPQQLDTFKDLLVEKQNTLRDVMMTARAQGVTDRTAVAELIKSAQTDIDSQIQSTLGSDAYAQYQQYEKTQPQRNVVNQLSQSLSYTNSPLTDDQSQQLIQILSDNSATSSASSQHSDAPQERGGPGGPMGAAARISDSAIAQAQNILSAAQVQALTQLQAQQKEQEELIQSLRASRQNATQANTPAQPQPPSQ